MAGLVLSWSVVRAASMKTMLRIIFAIESTVQSETGDLTTRHVGCGSLTRVFSGPWHERCATIARTNAAKKASEKPIANASAVVAAAVPMG